MSTRDKYVKARSELEKSEPNELRVSAKGNIGSYVTKSLELFDGGDQKKYESVLMRGIDGAIPIVLAAAEIIRRRVLGVHQINIITFTDIKEVYEPLEEGLVQVVDTKKLSLLLVKLTLNPTNEDKALPGYIAPLPESEVGERQPKRQYNKEGRDNNEERPRGDRQNRGGRQGGDSRDNREGGDRRPQRGGDRDRGDRRDNQRGGDRQTEGRRDDRDGGNRSNYRGNREGGNREGGNREGGNREGGNREGGNREGGNRDGGDRRRD